MTAFNSMEGNQGSSTMLVCPNCEFENPTTNKFCQQCGTLLETWLALIVERQARPITPATTVLAPPPSPAERSAAVVEVNETQLPAMGSPQPLEEVDPALVQLPSATDLPAPASVAAEAPEIALEALDPQQRYRVAIANRDAWLDWQENPSGCFAASAWDSQSSQKTFLETSLEQQMPEDDNAPSASSEFWNQLDIPAIARPYLLLQESHTPAIPGVRDAWQYGTKSVVLLEDRQGWELLLDRWGDEGNPLLQLLCWLDEMAKLWEALAEVGCCQSLLEETNLRLDEDQTLCVQRLYPDPPDRQPTLQDLGKMWQKLFGKSGRTLYDPLPQFLEKLRQGQFMAVDSVRAGLQAIAGEQDTPDSAEEEATEPPVERDLYNAPTAPVSRAFEKSSARASLDDIPTVVLPMQLLGITEAGYTDIGRQRDHNEDCFGITTEVAKEENALGKYIHTRGLYVVCDGMGGHAAGEVASAMAVETLQQYFKTCWPESDELPEKEAILEGVLAANQKIYDINQQNDRSGSGRMGTTLVMALVRDTKVAIAHVGDSRIYRITRKHGIEQLTTDHEVGQREIQRGVEPAVAYARPDAYQLTQALGPRSNNFVKPDINFLEINEDTLLLLCSDGLSDNDLLETHFQTYLTPLISSKADLDRGLQELIDFANHHNGHDNITGLLVRLKVRPNTDYQRF